MDRDEKMMEELMNNSLSFKKIKKGSILKGEIISSLKDEVVVNINYFCDGIIKKDELLKDIVVGETYLKGEKIDVFVVALDDGAGNVLLSEKKAYYENAVNELKKVYKSGSKVNVFVKEIVNAGLICDFKGVRGFIPKSRVSVNKVDLNNYLNKVLEVILIEFDISKNKVVFSRKEIELEQIEKHRKELLSKINVGDKFLGKVKNIKDFGIFVDIGGVRGFVHKSEMSYKQNFNTNDLVKVGDNIDVYVLNYDKENNKVALTMKDSNYSPFLRYKNDFIEGNIYDVNVLKILSSGIIVSLNDELTGFIHVSEISEDMINLNKSFKVGDKIKAKILSINGQEEKISLSYKKVFEEENDSIYEEEEILNSTLGDVFKDIFSKLK